MKRSLIRIALVAFGMLCIYALLPAQVTVSAAHLTDGGSPANGRISFQLTFTSGQPASYVLPGGGIATVAPVTALVTNGAFSVQLSDVSLTNPPDLCYLVTLSTSKSSALGPGYTCVQPHGTSNGAGDWCASNVCNFDVLAPYLPVVPSATMDLLATVQNGWNGAVQTAILMGTPPQVLPLADASVITLPTTVSGTHYTLSAFIVALTATISTRTLNLTGLTAGDRFLIQITPSPSTAGSPAPATTIVLGSGCVWMPAQNAGIAGLPNISMPLGQLNPIIVAAVFDGTNCSVYEVQ